MTDRATIEKLQVALLLGFTKQPERDPPKSRSRVAGTDQRLGFFADIAIAILQRRLKVR